MVTFRPEVVGLSVWMTDSGAVNPIPTKNIAAYGPATGPIEPRCTAHHSRHRRTQSDDPNLGKTET